MTLLPQPDSPTIASVSPRATENETPSTARTTPSRVKNQVLSPSTSRSVAVGLRSRALIGITCAARAAGRARRAAVAQQVHREHGQRQKDAGEEDQVAGDLEQAAPLGHDVAPARDVGRRAGADERQDRLGDHRRARRRRCACTSSGATMLGRMWRIRMRGSVVPRRSPLRRRAARAASARGCGRGAPRAAPRRA